MDTQKSEPPAQGSPENEGKIGLKIILRFLLVLLMPAALFLIAGRVDWWQAWVYLAIYVLSSIFSRAVVLRKFPDLIKERARFTGAQGAKSWDRSLAPVLVYGPLLVLVLAALDERFAWQPGVPLWLQLVGLAGIILGLAFSTWAMAVNRFFSAVVRIQTDRGQIVVTTGPYRIVRHPGYAGGVLVNFAIPLLLGSAWALIPAGVISIFYVLRTALEDRTLQEELPGYREYASQTRYRLLPGIW